MRSIAVTVWNGASAGTLNLLCRMIGASPVCLKETVTLPSFTTSTDILRTGTAGGAPSGSARFREVGGVSLMNHFT